MGRWCTLFSVTVTRVHCIFLDLLHHSATEQRVQLSHDIQTVTQYLGAAIRFSSVQVFHSGCAMYAMRLLPLAQVNFRPHTVVILNFCVCFFSGLRITFQSFGSATNAESGWMCSYFGNTVDFYSGDAWFQCCLAQWLCRLKLFIVLLSPFSIVLSLGYENF